MEEQLDRQGVDAEHVARVRGKLEILHVQHEDLSASLQELIVDVFVGHGDRVGPDVAHADGLAATTCVG
jgi:hypothetical protein